MLKDIRNGFSLVELLVVIAIIAILATIAITSYTNYTETTQKNVALANYNRLLSFAETSAYKCRADRSSTYVDGVTSCTALTASAGVSAIIAYITSHLTDPYTQSAAVASNVVSLSSLGCDQSVKGHFGISSSGSIITVISCVGSNSSDKQQASFTI